MCRREGRMQAGLAGGLALVGVDIWPVLLILALAGVLKWSGALGQVAPRTRVGAPVASARGSVPAVRFEDVGSQEHAKQELVEALHFLIRPEVAEQLGVRPLKGILFTGPPGTGKTLLAKAATNSSDAGFFGAGGPEFVEMYAGVGHSARASCFTRHARPPDRVAGAVRWCSSVKSR